MACELLSCLDLIETLLCCYNGDGTGDVAVSLHQVCLGCSYAALLE